MVEPNENAVSKTTKQEVAAAIGNSGIADSILKSFNALATQGQLVFPKGYSVGNQLKLMYTSLSQNGAISKVTPISIGEALTEAVIQGLEIDKKQVYFIPYDKKLTMFRSYYGDIAVAKRTGLVKDIRARVIYKGDEYELDTNEDGEEIIVGHKTRLENKDNQIVGAYAWAELPNGNRQYCIMTWKEIQANWSKSKNAGGSVQKEFPQEMAKRTVYRRLVKTIFNTSSTALTDEQKAIIGSYNRTTEEEFTDKPVKDYGARKSTVGNVIVDDDGTVIGDATELQEPPEDFKSADEDEEPAEEPKDTRKSHDDQGKLF